MTQSIREIARRAGGVAELARRIGVSPQAVYQWSQVPVDKLDTVSAATGLPKSALRPDLFGSIGASQNGDKGAYEADFAAWAARQAEYIRLKIFDLLDIDNLAEEVEDMARRERDEIESRLSVLLVHLLKWQVQPEGRTASWAATIFEQRARIARRLVRSPSLRGYPTEVFQEEYAQARKLASIGTGLPIERFPETPPFTVEEALDPDYFPDAVT